MHDRRPKREYTRSAALGAGAIVLVGAAALGATVTFESIGKQFAETAVTVPNTPSHIMVAIRESSGNRLVNTARNGRSEIVPLSSYQNGAGAENSNEMTESNRHYEGASGWAYSGPLGIVAMELCGAVVLYRHLNQRRSRVEPNSAWIQKVPQRPDPFVMTFEDGKEFRAIEENFVVLAEDPHKDR